MRKVVIVVCVLLALLIYALFDPSHAAWAPKCVFKLLTGCDCPSCGVQRAAHSLLNGDFRRAFWLNPYIVLVLPYFLALAITSFGKGEHMVRARRVVQHRFVIMVYVVLFLVWWVVRNTTWWHGVVENM